MHIVCLQRVQVLLQLLDCEDAPSIFGAARSQTKLLFQRKVPRQRFVRQGGSGFLGGLFLENAFGGLQIAVGWLARQSDLLVKLNAIGDLQSTTSVSGRKDIVNTFRRSPL